MQSAGSEREDVELVAAAKQGDEQSFELLFERYYDTAYRMAFRLSGRQAAAEDIAQVAFVKVARSLHRFRGDAKFSTWLYRIVCNAAYDWRKKQKNTEQLQDFHLEGQSKQVTGAEQSREILEALESLSPEERQAVVLSIYEGLTHAEIATISNCAESTVSWRFHKAKKKLKTFFTEL